MNQGKATGSRTGEIVTPAPGDFISTGAIFQMPTTKTYRCDQGHEMQTAYPNTLTVLPGNGAGSSVYQYCPFCWGEWLVKQWPMREI